MPVMLSRSFPLVEKPLIIAGRSWNLTFVEDQDALMDGVQTDQDLDNFPYGLMLWPSALGLAQRLAEEPERVRGQTVLELGAGAGLAGLVAAHLGATVTQTDYLTDALTLCRHNAARNGVSDASLCVRPGDWRDFPLDLCGAGAASLVIGADILYERALHQTLLELLPRVLAPGGSLCIADPLRPQAMDFLEVWGKTHQWPVRTESRQVNWEGERKDLAIVWMEAPDRRHSRHR